MFTDAMPGRIEGGLEKAGVAVLHGETHFTGRDTVAVNGETFSARHFHIATGARPMTLNIPGEELLTTSTDFLELPERLDRAAFVAGAISFLSPCVLPLVPGYLFCVAGRAVSNGLGGGAAALRLPAVGLSVCFVLGFSTVFVLLGASSKAAGQLLLAYRYELNIVGGAITVLFGLLVIGLLRPPWLLREFRFHATIPGGRRVSAYVLGLAFAFGWTPCIGPILGAILTVGAASATVSGGVSLPAVYSLGLGVPFLLAALFTDGLIARLKAFGRIGRALQLFAGVILVLMGIAMLTGQLSAFSYWLLDAFPSLAKMG